MNASAAFLMGSSIPSAKFEAFGTTVGGPIDAEPELKNQTDFTTGEVLTWKDGSPRQQLVVTVQTSLRDPQNPDDDGKRKIYIKGQMQKAVTQAVRNARAAQLDVGGTLTVTYTNDGVPAARGLSAPKEYSATYTPPAAAFVQGEQQPQAAPAATSAPAPHQVTTPAPTPATTAPAAGDDTPPPGFPADAWASLTPEAKAAMKNLQNK
ncbi:hypothetical protein CH267_02005 [Rhodococcus sp. 06-621-2]|nr:hypothetical protein [Rhodococcus sp. 06-621-2]OZC62332.1 hypothetical protein CH267_02005 [Rhodococcus sp. 06-621-2]